MIVQQFISNIYLIFDRIPVRFSNTESKYLSAIVTRWKGLDMLECHVELIISFQKKIFFKIFMYFLHSANTTGPNLSFFSSFFTDWLYGRVSCSQTPFTITAELKLICQMQKLASM